MAKVFLQKPVIPEQDGYATRNECNLSLSCRTQRTRKPKGSTTEEVHRIAMKSSIIVSNSGMPTTTALGFSVALAETDPIRKY